MASGAYTRAIHLVNNRTLDITSGCKVMLVGSEYTYDPDHDFIAAGGANDPDDAEIDATNYTRGFGGAGRKAATVTFAEQDGNNRAVIKIADLTWTALGGALNDTVEGAILIKEGTNDADSSLIAYFDLPTTPTNGSDFGLNFDDTDGNIRFTV